MDNKKFTPTMLNELRKELDAAVQSVAENHGITVRFGKATYDDLTAVFTVDLGFAPAKAYDPAKAIWDANCSKIGMEPSDFGKEFILKKSSDVYCISGYSTKARSNCVIIKRIRDGQEYVTTPKEVKIALGRIKDLDVSEPGNADDEKALNEARMNWALNCWRGGMQQSDFGKTIIINAVEYRIVGYAPKARVNTILIRRTKDGSDFAIRPEMAKKALEEMAAHNT